VLIDWFTVFAQIVNFLILVALLKYFLYDRIIKAMDEREKRIQSKLDEAKEKEQEASDRAEELQKKNRELDEQREKRLSEAREQAETKRKELVRDARQEIEHLRNEWHKSLEKEKESFLNHMREMVANEVFAITRRTLGDLADSEIEERVVEMLLDRLEKMEPEEKEELIDSINRADGGLVVRSSFELSSTLRQKTTRTLHELLAHDFEVEYEEDHDLILGVELQTPDRKLAWSVDDYLETLHEKARTELEKEAHRDEAKEDEDSKQAKEETENDSEKNDDE
jgi:F-type H+-transporting ATPase subunit b